MRVAHHKTLAWCPTQRLQR